MATLLYRLGLFTSRHPLTVLLSWLVVLAISVGSFAAFSGTLTSNIEIPNTPTSKVTERLQKEFPEAAKGSGAVVFRTDNDTALSNAQQQDIESLIAEVGAVSGVDSVVNPFATQEEIESQRDQLEQGREEIAPALEQADAGREQLELAREEFEAGEAALEAGQQELDDARAAAVAAGMPEEMLSQFDAEQEQLDFGKEQLELSRVELENAERDYADGRAEIDDAIAQMDIGESMLELVSEYSFISEDGSTAEASIVFEAESLTVPEETQNAVVTLLEDAEIDGVEVLPTTAISQTIPEVMGPAEVVGILVAGIVLLIMLGTFVTAGLPILNALIGVGIGAAGALAFSSQIEMLSVTPVLGIMLGLAVGIDYALFIIHRHRTQLKQGIDLRESIGLANGTSGNAVVFAGSTVVIALVALNVTGIPFLGLMGTVGAVCVAIAVLIAVTLTPSLLSWIGFKALTKKERQVLGLRNLSKNSILRYDAQEEESKIAPMKTSRAILTTLVTVVVLGILAIPFFSMRLGLPDGASEPPSSAAYQSYTALADKFGEGRNGPLVVTVDLPGNLDETELLEQQLAVSEQIADFDSVQNVVPAAVNDDQTMAMFQVIPEEGPNAESTEILVKELRDTELVNGASNLAVAGFTSAAVDISDALADVLPLYLAVVVGLSLIIMILVFRSILVPIIATGGFILSAFAAMGGVVAIYQFGWFADLFNVTNPAPILAFLPTIMVGVLFGLAMDYQLFIASGMREAYVHGVPARKAVQVGFRAGRSVVTAAAIIMVSVFGGFIFGDSAMIRPIGFGLAFGVMIDALIVRLLLIPSLMHLLGKSAWWMPRWLDRILPNVDVEGAKLQREHHQN